MPPDRHSPEDRRLPPGSAGRRRADVSMGADDPFHSTPQGTPPQRVTLRLMALWLACAGLVPAALFGIWAAPVMAVMDSIRRSRPKPDWILALHGAALPVLLAAFIATLVVSACLLPRRRRRIARRLLVGGSGGLLAASLAISLLVLL